jgi:hypothetical protein
MELDWITLYDYMTVFSRSEIKEKNQQILRIVLSTQVQEDRKENLRAQIHR